MVKWWRKQEIYQVSSDDDVNYLDDDDDEIDMDNYIVEDDTNDDVDEDVEVDKDIITHNVLFQIINKHILEIVNETRQALSQLKI